MLASNVASVLGVVCLIVAIARLAGPFVALLVLGLLLLLAAYSLAVQSRTDRDEPPPEEDPTPAAD